VCSSDLSVGWHVLGVVVIIALLAFIPDHHQNFDFVFTEKLNLVGFGNGSVTSAAFWFLVLPLGFLLTMYTQTGYDASAHTAEETRGAAIAAAQGVWRSVFWSAVIGWFVLLALLFAATDVGAINAAGGASNSIVTTALADHLWAAKLILIIVTVGQLFCGAAGLTSASRTWYAFSRDRAMPGWTLFRRLNRDKVPFNAVIAVAVASLIITIPANWSNAAAPTSPGRSSLWSGSARSASTSPTRSRSICGCDRATTSRSGPGTWARNTAGSTGLRSSGWRSPW